MTAAFLIYILFASYYTRNTFFLSNNTVQLSVSNARCVGEVEINMVRRKLYKGIYSWIFCSKDYALKNKKRIKMNIKLYLSFLINT